MQKIEFPKTVRDALGPRAAQDLEDWVEQRIALNESLPISAAVARRKVNVLTLEQISNLLLADDPTLTSESGLWVWRVPIDLTFPNHGRVARVGELDVDAHSGAVYFDDETLAHMRAKAEEISRRVLDSR